MCVRKEGTEHTPNLVPKMLPVLAHSLLPKTEKPKTLWTKGVWSLTMYEINEALGKENLNLSVMRKSS